MVPKTKAKAKVVAKKQRLEFCGLCRERPAEGLAGSQAAEAAAECSGLQGAPEGAQHPLLPPPRWPPRGEGLSLQEALESRIAKRAATRLGEGAVREVRRSRRDRSVSGSRS
eukprot:301671-Amphidinium_carterae.1